MAYCCLAFLFRSLVLLLSLHIYTIFAQLKIISIIYFHNIAHMTHNLLKGKRGIIFGALNEHSIAWKVAVKAVEEGATIKIGRAHV